MSSKKSRSGKGPADNTERMPSSESDRDQVTVVEGPTLRLGPSSRLNTSGDATSLTPRDPEGTLVSRVDPPAAGLHRPSEPKSSDDAPTAMIDVAALGLADDPPSQPKVPPTLVKAVPAPPPSAGHAPRPPSGGAAPAPLRAPAAPPTNSLADKTLDVRTMAVAPPAKPAEVSKGPLGLDIVMRWSGELHKARFFARPAVVTIGKNGTFVMPEDVMGNRDIDTLVVPDAKDGFALVLANAAISGQLIMGSEVYAIADIKAGKTPLNKDKVPLGNKTQAFLEFGTFTFVVSRGAVPPMAPPALWDRENSVLLVCALLAAAFILGPVIASFQLTDPRDRRAKTYMEEMDERTAEIIEVEKIEEKKEEKAEDKKEEKAEAPKNEVPIQRNDIVKKQDELVKVIKEAPTAEQQAKIEAIVKNEADKATAKVDEALNNLPTTKMFGEVDDSAAAVAGGPAVIANVGDGPDTPGNGRAGPDVGSADDARAQAGGLDKKVAVGGDGKNPAIGADLGKRDQKVISIKGGAPTADGELSPDIIKKVMADKAGAVKACYQKELQKNPDLSGAIKVAFMIGADGKVVGVKIESSSIDNVQVENCIVDNIKSWRFPQAKGGGNTKVNKTFQFKSS